MAASMGLDPRLFKLPGVGGLPPGYAPQSTPMLGNDAASLKQRYGNMPETVQQWNTINGFDQNRAAQPFNPVQGNPTAPAGSPLNPNGTPPQPAAPQAAPQATPQGGGTDYNSYLQGLIGKASAYDPTAGINDAFRQMREYVGQQTVGDATAQMGARGLLPSDNTSQDLKAVLMGRAMNPIAVQHSQALANAGQQGLQNQMSLAQLLSDSRRMDQAQSWQQQQHEYQKQQDALNNQWRQQQADAANKQWQSQFDWTKQQTTNQQIHGGVVDPQGNPIAPGAAGPQQAPQQSSQPSFFDLIGRAPGSPAPTSGGGNEAPPPSAGGSGMGGGAGLGSYNEGSFGQPTAGWNSGRGRSGDPNARPFEGPSTSTVGTSQNGPTTNGTGTTVGAGSPFGAGSNAGSAAWGSLGGGTATPSPFNAGRTAGTTAAQMAPRPPAPQRRV